MHIDHAHIKNVGLVLILVDVCSGWPEAIWVKDHSVETVKAVLRAVFARLGVPQALVSNNAAEFVAKGWWIGYIRLDVML